MSPQSGDQEVTICYLAAEVATYGTWSSSQPAGSLAELQTTPIFCKLTAEIFGLGVLVKRDTVNHCIAAKITF